MKTLLLGSSGQVGSRINFYLEKNRDFDVIAIKRSDIDLSEKSQIINFFEENHKFELIINAAAFTYVDLAESQKKECDKVNNFLLKEIASYCKKNNALLIHYSTDYIFDGKKNLPYVESDSPNPLNYYGLSKLNGENEILNSKCKYMIFRVSWIYSKNNRCFPNTMIDLFKNKDKVEVVDDQLGVPTSNEFIALNSIECILKHLKSDNGMNGIYHLVPDGSTSWFGFAKIVFDVCSKNDVNLDINKKNILPIKTASLSLPAIRPSFSVLDNQKIKDTFGLSFMNWEVYFKEIFED